MPWLEKAIELKRQGVPWTRLPQELQYHFPGYKFTFDMVRNRIRRSQEYQKGLVKFADKHTTTSENIDDLLEQLINIQQSLLAVNPKQTEATITIEDTRAIGICKIGDKHVGGWGVDHYRLIQDTDTIAKTDGLYAFGMGDYGDRYTGSIPGTPHEQILNPDTQQKIILHLMTKMKAKMLVLLAGCHENFVLRDSNTDLTAECAKAADAVYLWHGGEVYINLGLQQYHYRLRHKYKGDGGVNLTNAHRILMADKGPCDIQVIAHRHFGDLHTPPQMGGQVFWFRSGTYKYLDEHGQKLAGYEGMYAVPVSVIYPDQHKIVPFLDFHTGIDYLTFVRSNLREV